MPETGVSDQRSGRPERRPAHDPWEGLDVRPLDPLRSFKVKLGVLVATTVTVGAVLTWAGLRSSVPPWVTIPVVVALCLVVTQILARGMTRPLRQMTRAARAMARGDYSQRIDATSRDEVGQLAEAFTVMARDLEQTDRLRRDLVANVSHELRTPVAALRGQLENLVDGVTAPDERSLGVALTATERLSELVDHLLDLSRIDAGVAALDRQRIDLLPFLHEAVDAAQLAAAARGREVRWLVDVRPRDLWVQADPARLHQVIANLLDNAGRHTPPGGQVRLRAGEGEDGRSVWIEVEDDGPGIPRDERERVFERFQRGGGADATGGTGLGLAIARWVAELHDGTIEVADPGRDAASGPEASSRIRLTLPRRDHVSDPQDGERPKG
ncbi:HAMP domain-containing histidine kinase [Brachybacterium sp. EF45031]|uniref:HAMP domain-containing sensor histidine kinase n=1 Tax=Brachybacterium sillae TaxID=2810536 RepID=UPI00217D8AB4|nr:HAMP domain-containing sensor histidine kinase [Brachybacterium sillae]MCS6710936.1 HAMP domain-containing histidine kinase [Brachybacterium sillae]